MNLSFNNDGQSNRYDGYTCKPHDCTIHKAEFKRYLQSVIAWPIAGLLAKWWPDDKLQSSDAGNIDKLEAGAADDKLDPPQDEFDKRLAVLQNWLEKQEYYVTGKITTLPKGTNHKKIQIILDQECKDSPLLDSSLFDLTLESFVRHFWTPQKIARLKRGR